MHKISIMTPVYNVEPYLRACLDSITGQTYTNTEIILVNDGSTDNSGKIADEYAAKDSRIKVIHKQNKGVAEARNTCVANATGDYLMFVDSDDIISTDYCETLYNLAVSNKADIAVCKRHIFKDTLIIPARETSPVIQEFTNLDALNRNYILEGDMGTVWGKIFKRELFDGIVFPPGRLADDDAVSYKLVYKANKIVLTTEKIYYYRMHGKSITNTRYTLRDLDYITVIKERSDFFKEHNLEELYGKNFCFYCGLIIKNYCRLNASGVENKKYHLKKLYDLFMQNYKEVMANKYTKPKLKPFFFLFTVFPRLFTIAFKIRRF